MVHRGKLHRLVTTFVHIRQTKPRWWDNLHRDVQVFIHLFPWRVTFIIFIALMMAARLFQWAYAKWECGGIPDDCGISFIKATFAIVNMAFLQLTFADMPKNSTLDYFPVVVLIIGLPLLSFFGLRVVKVLRIFFVRAERGQEWQEALIHATMQDHIIVCGMGRIGYLVAKSLAFDHQKPVAGINDSPSPLVDELLKQGIPVILGNTETDEALIKAGIDRAKVVVICTNEDWVNLGTAALVKKLNPQARIVLRLFEDDLMEEIKTRFSLDTVISRSAVAATTITYGAIGGTIVETFRLADRSYVLAQMPIGPTSPMIGQTIAEIAEEQDVTIVCHHRRETLTVEPAPEMRLFCHDTLFVFTTVEEMLDLIENGVNHPSLLTAHSQERILVCGLGHTGYRVASNLLDLGCLVIGLDYKPTRLSNRLQERKVDLKFGDIRWKSVLLNAGVDQATAVVACTDDDMTNIQIALRARTLNPMIRIVMRIFDRQLRDQLSQSLGANAFVYSTSAIAAPTFVAAALNRMNIRPVKIGQEIQAIVRLQIESPFLKDLPVSKLQFEDDLTVLLHARGDEVHIPPDLSMHLQIGDEIVVMATEAKLEALSRQMK